MTFKQIGGLTLLGILALSLIGCGAMVRGSGTLVTQDIPVSDFTSIQIDGSGDVVFVQGDEVSVVVKTDDNIMQYASAAVRGDTLHVGLNARNISVSPTELTFFVTGIDVDEVTVSGSGDFSTAALEANTLELSVFGSGDILVGKLDTTQLDLRVSGSGDISVGALNGETLDAAISGSGDIVVRGDVVDQTVQVRGSGQYWSKELRSETADVAVSGSGEVSVWASDELDVTISGSGDVSYYGDPRLTTSSRGSGDVTARG